MSSKVAKILTMRLAESGLPIAAENTPFKSATDQLYVHEQLLGDTSPVRQIAGGPRNNRSGLYQLTVMAPKDGTKFPARRAIDALEALFFAGYASTQDGVTVSIRRTVMGPTFDEGDRFAVVLTVEYMATGA